MSLQLTFHDSEELTGVFATFWHDKIQSNRMTSAEELLCELEAVPEDIFCFSDRGEKPSGRQSEVWNMYTKDNKHQYVPTHSRQLRVAFDDDGAGEVLSELPFSKGDKICNLTNLSQADRKTLSSVQYGWRPDENFEFNSDLAYLNHSCTPNVALDLSSAAPADWSLYAVRDIARGDHLTRCYFATESQMAPPFLRHCPKQGGEANRHLLTSGATLSLGDLALRKEEWGVQHHVFVNKIIEMSKTQPGRSVVFNRLKQLSQLTGPSDR